jgi:hypothetical protein
MALINLLEEIRTATEFTDYAVAVRYPGPIEPVTEYEYNGAVRSAEMTTNN